MRIEDIKVSMKVRLLSKHGLVNNYDNIEDWYKDCNYWEEVQQIKEQGFGIITDIKEYGDIWVSNTINGNKWRFLPSDLEPYEEESTQTKSPKEWLLTPSVICTTRNGREFVVVSNEVNVTLDNFNTWSGDLNLSYDEKLINAGDCPPSDIMKITYGKEIVWERKEEVKKMTLKEIERELGYKIEIISE